MLHFYHVRKQGLLQLWVFLLCALLPFAQFLEAEHAADPDCDEQYCLFCHASADDDDHSSSFAYDRSSKFPDLSITLASVMLDTARVGNLPIRAPPQLSL